MNRRRTIVLFLVIFSNYLGATVVLPTLPLYAQRHFSMSPEAISSLLAAYFIAQFIASPTIGQLSDRFGRVPVLVVSQLGTFISFIMLGFAASVPMLFAARILDGITGGNVIVAQAYIADVSPREKRAQSLGLVWMAFGLGYILGPAIGGIVAALFSDRASFLLGAGISLVSLLMTWLLLDESLTPELRVERLTRRRPSLGLREIYRNTPLVLVLIIGFGAQLALSLMTSTLALFGEAVLFAGQTPDAVNLGVGLLLACVGVGQFFTQLVLIKRMVPRFGERRLVVMGTLARGLALFGLGVAVMPVPAGAALLLFAVASGIMMPTLQALATTSVSHEYNGVVLGYYQAATTLGIISGTALGGWFFAHTPALPFLVGGGLLLITMLPGITLMRRAQPVVAAS
ncbi:MAG: MFS transporter [Anaerolineae bacterium]|nr:MFS transporter [Anaerolineae bacterium]